MVHEFDHGVKLVLPDDKQVNVLLSFHAEDSDDIGGIQKGNLIDLMAMSVNSAEELLKCMPKTARKAFVVTLANMLTKEAKKIDGVDVMMMKMTRKEDADEEDI